MPADSYQQPVHIFFHGSREDLIKKYPRPGPPSTMPDHFDEFIDLAEYGERKSLLLKQAYDGARILFETGTKSRLAMANIVRKLSTLPSLFDRLPRTSFFIRSDYSVNLPPALKARVRCVSGPRESIASAFVNDPKLFQMPVHEMLYPELLKGTLSPGYRYSNALVSAMRAIQQIRILERV